MHRSALGLLCLAAAGCTGKYVRPTTSERVEATPARLERGEYIVTNLASCGACHTTRASGDISDAESTDALLGGQNVMEDDGLGFRVWIPNITSDESGVGKWSDDQLMRGIRDGVKPDGSLMVPFMPFGSYQHMSDEDVRSVVAYLRSVPKVKSTRARIENKVPFPLGMIIGMGAMHHAPAHDVPPPNNTDPIQRGQYLAYLGHCAECHSLGSMGPIGPDSDEYMSGSRTAFSTPGIGKAYARNLTPDPETGLGRYSAEQIKQSLLTGKRLDGKVLTFPMAAFMPHLSGMKPEDMDALVAWLKSLKPVKHAVPERELRAKGKKLAGEG